MNVFVRFGSRVLAAGLQAIFLFMLARILSPAGFGAFSVALGIGTFVAVILGWGASTRVLRICAELDSPGLVADLFLLRLGTVVFAVAGSLSAVLFGLDWEIAWLAALLAAGDSIGDFGQAKLAGRERFGRSACLVVAQRAIPAMALVLAIEANWPVNSTLYVALSLTFLLGLIVAFERINDFQTLIPTARSSAGYWFASSATNLRQLEPAVIASTVGQFGAGIFGIATRLTNPLLIFTSALQTIYTPALSRALGSQDFEKVFRKLLSISVLYALVLLIAAYPAAGVAIRLLGVEYESVKPILIALVVASALSAVTQSYMYRMIAEGRPSRAAVVIATVTLFGLGGFGIVGVVVGMAGIWIIPILVQLFMLVGVILISKRAQVRSVTKVGQL